VRVGVRLHGDEPAAGVSIFWKPRYWRGDLERPDGRRITTPWRANNAIGSRVAAAAAALLAPAANTVACCQ